MNHLRRTMNLKPDNAEAHYKLGLEFKAQGRADKALSCFQKAVQSEPDHADAHLFMGILFQEQGQLEKAFSCYQNATRVKPDYAQAFNNMGNVLKARGNFDDAISHYQKALALKPDYAEAYNNMGIAFQDQGKFKEAVSCYQEALNRNSQFPEFYDNMGNSLQYQGQFEEAISCYQKALALRPDYAAAHSHLVVMMQQTCTWNGFKDLATRLDALTDAALNQGVKTVEMPLANLMRHANPRRNLAVARSWAADIARRMAASGIRFSSEERRLRKEKIRIGYLSNDFCNHPVAHLMVSLFGLHDRNEFEIFCYSYGRDDSSYYRKKIAQDCDQFTDLRHLNHGDAARRIHHDQVDILLDLMGHTQDNRLEISALRPAPVQVTYLGFLGTTGADFFDYIITDEIVTPAAHAPSYKESLVYLPHCYQINDHAQPSPGNLWKREDFGLPENGVVFCSFNEPYKIEPVMFDVWMRILSQVPGSVLWLLQRSGLAEKNLRQEAEARGVASDRLIFSGRLPLPEHLARLRLADLALDTRIYNGGATTSNVLWAGVPLITLQGGHFVSRMSSSGLKAIGLPELITHTPEEYEQLAIYLATHPDERRAIGQRLEKNRLTEPLFDTPRFVRNLESAYQKMWEIFLAGEKPRQIRVREKETSRGDEIAERILPPIRDAKSHYRMGIRLKNHGKPDEAISCFQKALKLDPNLAKAHVCMGNIFQTQGQSGKAASCYEKAIKSQPKIASAYNNLGNIVKDRGRTDEAIRYYRKALQFNPNMASACNNLLFQLRQICAWEEAEAVGARLDDLTQNALDRGIRPDEVPFMNLVRHANPHRNFTLAKSWSDDIARRVSNWPRVCQTRGAWKRDKRQITVGYFSNDFQNHPTSHLMLSLFGLHRRNAFRIFCYSSGPDDGSFYRKKIVQDCDQFIDLQEMNPLDAAGRICEDQVDILVDLMGYAGGNRLSIPALRPAPVQVCYLGFPGTTGADFFDYIITDQIVTPQSHVRHYSEHPVYLPHCYQVNDHAQPIADKNWKKSDMGLPENGFVFSSFNRAYKTDPLMFGIWMSILRQVPESVLWLLPGNADAEKNLRHAAEAAGVDPQRLIFAKGLPKPEHLARQKFADLALDTRIYNGHTTTSDALWAGVPVLTLQGTHFASSVSSSLLTAIGLSDLITSDLEEYESLAVYLARHPRELGAIRRRLAKNRSVKPLFDTPRFVRNLERAYKKMWRIFLSGQKPRAIRVKEIQRLKPRAQKPMPASDPNFRKALQLHQF